MWNALKAFFTNPILNSNFTIFFLSSVIIALVAFVYQSWVAHNTAAQTVTNIRHEVHLRIQTMNRIRCGHDLYNLGTIIMLRDEMYGSLTDPFIPHPSYAEFENRSTSELLSQSYDLDSRSVSEQDIDTVKNLESLLSQTVLNTLHAFRNSKSSQPCRSLDVTSLLLNASCTIPGSEGQSESYDLIGKLATKTPWKSPNVKYDGNKCAPLSITAPSKV
jgi:hypothetical protein